MTTRKLQIGDRVKTPMPVNAPKGRGRVTSSVGQVTHVMGAHATVKMDGNDMSVTFVVDTLEVIE